MAEPNTGPDGRPGTLRDGFNVIAKDLDRAFALALSPNEAVVMLAVREQSWSATIITRAKGQPRPEPMPARLNLSALAKASGCNRPRLSTALRGLVAGKVLVETEAGYLVNKDYSRWRTPDGTSPRFCKGQLDFIRDAKRKRKQATAAPDNSQAPSSDGSQVVLQSATDCCNPQQSGVLQSATGCCNPQQGVLQNATVSVADCNRGCCELQQSHLEERARDLDSQKIERPSEDAPSERTQSAGVRDPRTGDDLEPFECPGIAMPPRVQPSGADSAAARELEAWAGGLGCDRSGEPYAGWARAMCDLVPAAWVRRLLERRVLGRQGAGRASLPLCAKILADWQAAGQCEYETPAPAPAVNGHLPTPAAPRAESPSERRRRELKESLHAFKVPGPTEGESDAR